MIRVLFNKKGGVGKSSLTVNLAAISAAQGLRTLVLDLDTQCNTTSYLSALSLDEDDSIAALFEQTITFHLRKRPIIEYCQPTQYENLFVIRGSERIKEMESELDSRHKIYKLRDALKSIEQDFDRIYIDTPPALNFYTLSALIAADTCLIPIDCDDFARQGLYSLQQQIQEISEDHNDALTIEGIIANQYMSNANLPKQIIQELVDEGLPVVKEYIPQSVKMRESHQLKAPLIHMAAKHKLTEALLACYHQLEG